MNPNSRIVGTVDVVVGLVSVVLISVAFWLQIAGVEQPLITVPMLLVGVIGVIIYGRFLRHHLQKVQKYEAPLKEDSKETKDYHRGYYDGMHGADPLKETVAYETGYEAGKTGKARQLEFTPRNENPKVEL